MHLLYAIIYSGWREKCRHGAAELSTVASQIWCPGAAQRLLTAPRKWTGSNAESSFQFTWCMCDEWSIFYSENSCSTSSRASKSQRVAAVSGEGLPLAVGVRFNWGDLRRGSHSSAYPSFSLTHTTEQECTGTRRCTQSDVTHKTFNLQGTSCACAAQSFKTAKWIN